MQRCKKRRPFASPVGTAAALFLAARAPERVTSLTVGGGAVRFPIDVGGALKEIIEAPSLDVVRALDARTNISYAVEAGAASVGNEITIDVRGRRARAAQQQRAGPRSRGYLRGERQQGHSPRFGEPETISTRQPGRRPAGQRPGHRPLHTS